MLQDVELIFSDAQAITVDSASTKAIDTKKAGRAIPEMYLVVQVETDFDSVGDAGTLVVKLQTDSDPEFGTATDLYISQTFTQAALVAGAELIKMRLPEGLKQHIRLYYDNEAAAFTAGKIDAFLVDGVNLD